VPGVLFLPVIAGHAHEVLATATAAGAPPPQPGLPWVDRLTAGSYCMDASFMLF